MRKILYYIVLLMCFILLRYKFFAGFDVFGTKKCLGVGLQHRGTHVIKFGFIKAFSSRRI